MEILERPVHRRQHPGQPLISSNGTTNDDIVSFSSLSRTRINSNPYAPSTPQLNFKPLQQSSPLQPPPSSHLTNSPFPQRLNTTNSLFPSNSNPTSTNGPFSHSSSFHPQSPVTHQTQQLLPLPQQAQRPLMATTTTATSLIFSTTAAASSFASHWYATYSSSSTVTAATTAAAATATISTNNESISIE